MSACVVDSSAWVSTLIAADGRGDQVLSRLQNFDEWWVPEAFDLEVLYAMRGSLLRGLISLADLLDIGQTLMSVSLQRIPTSTLDLRIVALAPSASTYDAAFVAVAELLDVPLVTTDARLARAPGPRCEFLLVTDN